MKIVIALLIYGTFFIGSVNATVLGELAASLKPGQWAELKTIGFTESLLRDPSGHYMLQYTDDGVWNPNTRQFLYIGGPHAGTAKFISYSDETNTWRQEPDPPFIDQVGHGYDHNAIDPQNGILYHHPMSGRKIIHAYVIASDWWRTATTIPDNVAEWGMIDCCRGLCYFPEMKSLVITLGRSNAIVLFGTSTGKFTKIDNLPIGDPHSFAKYNPIEKCVLFGGGNGSEDIHRLDATGQVTPLGNPPTHLGIATSVQTVDPVSGKYLIFGGNGVYYEFDIMNDSWKSLGSNAPFFDLGPDGPSFGTIAAPISTYGVIMFANYNFSNSDVWIYKHAGGAAIDAYQVPETNDEVIQVSPNPFSSRTTIRVKRWQVTGDRWMDLKVYDINGKMVKDLSSIHPPPSTFHLQAEGLSPGIYILQVHLGTTVLTKQIVLI
jgi:hypothetical protein